MEKFLALEAEKRERILNAGMKEFAANGFDRASTNAIVKEAGISKGLLFHYFTSKKQFYLYLFQYGAELTMKEFYAAEEWRKPDLLDRLELMMGMKLEIWQRHPELFRFLETAYLESSAAVQPELGEQLRILQNEVMPEVLSGIDLSRFREGIEPGRAIQLILWSLEKVGDHLLKQFKPEESGAVPYKEMTEETKRYLELLRRAFYS